MLEDALTRLTAELDGVYRARLMLLETPEELARRLKRETEVRPIIDAACLDWIEKSCWPKLEPESALFAWDRVSQGRFLAAWLRDRDFELNGPSEQECIKFLLISAWSEFGVHRFRYQAGTRPIFPSQRKQ